jgi:hypothetical protein
MRAAKRAGSRANRSQSFGLEMRHYGALAISWGFGRGVETMGQFASNRHRAARSDYTAVLANLNTGTLWTQRGFYPAQTTCLGDSNAVISNFNSTAGGN